MPLHQFESTKSIRKLHSNRFENSTINDGHVLNLYMRCMYVESTSCICCCHNIFGQLKAEIGLQHFLHQGLWPVTALLQQNFIGKICSSVTLRYVGKKIWYVNKLIMLLRSNFDLPYRPNRIPVQEDRHHYFGHSCHGSFCWCICKTHLPNWVIPLLRRRVSHITSFEHNRLQI